MGRFMMTAQSDNVQSWFDTIVNFQPWFTNRKIVSNR